MKEEKYIGPVPDYMQIMLSLFYMFSCVFNTNQVEWAANMVNLTKYIQGLSL